MSVAGPAGPESSEAIRIPPIGLEGVCSVPQAAAGLILFAHGSGSSRLSPRNNYVARALRDKGFGTLLFDLLTEVEAADRANVFDIPLLADRLQMATEWVRRERPTAGLPVGFFGASTGAAAALVAAAHLPKAVGAIVSRGGRPDLAGEALRRVKAPTLLIVGGNDLEVLALNRAALAELSCEKDLKVVPGATHLFEEPGTLDQVIALASAWFGTRLVPTARR
jgi:putative phosphoribosyl transferase